MFKETSEMMGNGKYPTVQQTLAIYNLLMNRINRFLRVSSSNEHVDVDSLEAKGIPRELINAAIAGRTKLMKYYSLAEQTKIHYICTGNLMFILQHWLVPAFLNQNDYFFFHSFSFGPKG
jgi:hypothetical protein